MSATAKKTIKALAGGLVKVSGDVTLGDLYAAIPSRELYVEPLSASQTFAEFLAEGGVGFGSLGNGTFAGQLTEVRSAYGGTKFTYGLGKMPLYNVGYPLQRELEGKPSGLLKHPFEAPSEMVLRTRPRRGVKLDHAASGSLDPAALQAADGAENVMFLNDAAAGAMGLPGAGLVTVRRLEVPATATADNAAWSKRFALGSVPDGHGRIVILAQPSTAKALSQAHAAECPGGVFVALAVHLGVLVVASAEEAAIRGAAKRAEGLPLAWRLA